MEIVTGYTGEAHVYSSDVRAFNRNVMGNGNYVLKNGGHFSHELVNNNTLRIFEGDLLLQGVHARIRTGEYIDVTFSNAGQGAWRNILICAAYSMDTSTEEHMNIIPIYGREFSSNPSDPMIISDDLSRNGTRAYFPLFRVVQNASNVSKVEVLFTVQENDMESLSRFMSQAFLLAHPVGSIFFTTNGANPGTIYGGTWAAWGQGRVPVGVNTSDSNYNAAEKTGGASTVSLTVANLPAHNHGLNSHTHGKGTLAVTVANHSHSGLYHGGNEITYFNDLMASGSLAGLRGVSSGTTVKTGSTQPSASVSGNTAAASGSTANTGSGTAHSNLQPYITCYMWKRTA